MQGTVQNKDVSGIQQAQHCSMNGGSQ